MLNLQKKAGSDSFNVKEVYVLKEGTLNCVQITFRVHNDIVSGLRYCTFIKRRLIQEKDEEVLGSFSPTVETHVVQCSPEVVPEGFLARAKYAGKAMLIDV